MKGLTRGHWKGWCPFLERWLFGELYEAGGVQYIISVEMGMACRCEKVTRMEE